MSAEEVTAIGRGDPMGARRRSVAARLVVPSVVLAVVILSAVPASAVCPMLSEADHQDHAAVIFDGRALAGPENSRGVLLSPVRFEVIRYLKGSGPDTVAVRTGWDKGDVYVEDAIQPRPGDLYRIYGAALQGNTMSDRVCGGSHRMTTLEPFLPATGIASRSLIASGGLLVLSSLGLLAAIRRPRRASAAREPTR